MPITPEELDAYERAQAAERAVAMGSGDEDAADQAMDDAERAARR